MKCDELQRHSIRGEMYNGEEICGGFSYYDADEVDAAIAELKRKLESVQATAYAESVDAGMRERRLRRALYKACANWAHHRVFVRYKTNEKAWENVERKCRAKAEQYE